MSILSNAMLAENLELSQLDGLKYPVLASRKIDGVRFLSDDGVIKGRSLKPFRNKNLQSIHKVLQFPVGVDGEICVGSPTDPNCIQKTVSFVNSAAKMPIETVTFFVFDYQNEHLYPERFELLTELIKFGEYFWNGFKFYVTLVAQTEIENGSMLLEYHKKGLDLGYEGTMVRSFDSIYKNGRSTLKQGYLLKLKPFVDSEAVVLAVEEQMQNTNEASISPTGYTVRSTAASGKVGKGVMGRLLVKDMKTGVTFYIGTGKNWTDSFRKEVFENQESYIKRILKYKYQPIGIKEKPRLPVGLSFRCPEDL